MSVQKVNVLVPPLRSASPKPTWFADLAAWLFAADDRAASRLVARIEATRARFAAARAESHQARSRAHLMALAQSYEATQPEFAKDLYAAACNDRGPLGIGLHR